MRRKLIGAVLLAAIAAALGWHFTRKALSDREQLEQLLDQVQRAAHTKDVKLGLSCLSRDYRDSSGLNKWAIHRLALRAGHSPETFRVLISDLNLSLRGREASARMEVQVMVRNGEVIEGEYAGPLVLSFRKERGGWRITSSSGWQSWAEGLE